MLYIGKLEWTVLAGECSWPSEPLHSWSEAIEVFCRWYQPSAFQPLADNPTQDLKVTMKSLPSPPAKFVWRNVKIAQKSLQGSKENICNIVSSRRLSHPRLPVRPLLEKRTVFPGIRENALRWVDFLRDFLQALELWKMMLDIDSTEKI